MWSEQSGGGVNSGSREPGRTSQVTVRIPDFIKNEMGNHRMLLRKVLTYILSLAIRGEKTTGRQGMEARGHAKHRSL